MTDEEREQEFRHFDERRERYIAEQTALTVDQVRVALDAGEWRFLMEHPGNIDAASRLKDASDEERAESPSVSRSVGSDTSPSRLDYRLTR